MAQTHNIAATISKASGPVTILRDGHTLTLHEGDKVFSTDTIKTQSVSVELSFEDGAKAMLGPQTVMTIQEFSTSFDDPSFILNLATGAMRSISGKVVEQNPDAFKVFTPKATVGIRGTDFITKVNADGSEVHAVISLSQGHNLVITTHDGEQISLTTSSDGAFIGSGASTTLSPYNFTDEELEEIVGAILGVLDYEEGSDKEDTEAAADSSLESLRLEQSLVEVLSEEGVVELLEALTEAGIISGDGTDSDDLSLGNQEDIVLGLNEDDPETPFDDGYVNMSTLGNAPFYADMETNIDAATHKFSNHRVTISANMDTAQDAAGNDVVISGDINSMSGGTVTGGSDEITGLNASAGRIVGDANTVTGGTLTAGSDTITLDNKTGGASLYGDAYSVSGASIVDFGHDQIHVKNTLSNTTVSGDANIIDVSTATITTWGNDSIHVGGSMTNASIYGDYNDPASLYGGHDTITVDGEMDSTSTIYGNGGDDAIQIGSYGGGIIDGGEGTDSLTIQILTSDYTHNQISNVENITINGVGNNGVYAGTTNADDIAFEHLSGTGRIEGQDGDDNLTISQNMNGGTLDGGAGADSLYMSGTMSGGAMNGGDDDDSVYISGAMNGGTIDGGAGIDSVHVMGSSITGSVSNVENLYLEAGMAAGTLTLSTATDLSKDDTTAFSMSGGTIIGSNGIDDFTLASHTGGTINAADGDDVYTITALSGGTFDGGSGTDTVNLQAHSHFGTIKNSGAEQDALYLQSGMSSGTLTLESSGGGFHITQDGANAFTMSGGTLNASAGNDSIFIADINAGTINAGAGNDSISIEELAGGTIDSGAGVDTIDILSSNDIFGTIINSGMEQDALFLRFGINGHILTLQSSGGGFNITKDGSDAFGMDDGTLNASAAADTISISSFVDGTVNAGGGADSISIDLMLDGMVNGDAGADTITITTMNNGSVNGNEGDDSFTISTMNGGTIDGGNGTDRATLSNSTQTGAIHNIEHIYLSAGIAAGALTLGGAGSSLSKDGTDGFDLSAAASIIGSNGADTFTMQNMTGGTLNGGAGNDIFTAATYTGGILTGGAGSDTFTIGGSVTAGNAVDLAQVSEVESLIFTSVTGGTVTGSADAEHITITTMNGGTIDGNGGADTLIITNLEGTNNTFKNLDELHINGTGSYSTENVTTVYVNGQELGKVETVDTLSDGDTLTGTNLFDAFTVRTWEGGTIESLNSGDAIYVENTIDTVNTLSVTNSGGADTIYLENGMHQGTLNLTGAGSYFVTGDTLLNGFTMTGGTINGGAIADTFNIASLSLGTVNGGNGADTFTIASLSGGTVNGGEGNDLFSVQSLTSGTLDGGDGIDTLSAATITSNINLASVVNVEHFTVQTVDTGGTLSLTNNADTIQIANLTGTGIIDGLAGDDTITIASASGGTVSSGEGADSVTLQNVTNTVTLNNSNGHDNYYLSSGLGANVSVTLTGNGTNTLQGGFGGAGLSMGAGASITGGSGNDTFYMAAMSIDASATINGGAGDDSYYFTEAIIRPMGTLSNTAGADTVFIVSSIDGAELSLSGAAGFTIAGDTASSGFTMANSSTITGTGFADTFIVGTTMATNTINTGEGADTLAITVMNSSSSLTIHNTGTAVDNVHIQTDLSAGQYTLSTADAGFSVTNAAGTGFTQSGGSLLGSAAADTFTVNSITGGSLNGGAGDDSIVITTWSGGTITGGDGSDSIDIVNDINTAQTYEISTSGTGTDTIDLHAGMTAGTINFTSSSSAGFHITGSNNGSGVIMNGGTITASNNADTITIYNMSGGTISGQAGNDTFLAGQMNDGIINGGDGNDDITVTIMNNGDINGGDGSDTILITTWTNGDIDLGAGTMANTVTIENAIDTAIPSIDINSAITSGFDTIIFENGITQGIVDTTNTEGGAFHIQGSTGGVSIAGGGLYTSEGADSIEIATQSDGIVGGLAGNDTITADDLQGTGQIDGGDGQDYITVTTMSDGLILGDAGDDEITVTTMSGGNIGGGEGQDEIFIRTWSGGTIDGGEQADSIIIENNITDAGTYTIDNMSGIDTIDFYGSISAGTFNFSNNINSDGFHITGAGNGNGLTMSGGSITGSYHADTIDIFTLSNGSIDGSFGNDTISIGGTFNNGSVDGGGGNDSIEITLNANIVSGTISGDAGEDTITIEGRLEGGTINGGTDNDYIKINANMISGTINGDSGNDTILFDDGYIMQSGTINGGFGDDSIIISHFEGGSITNSDGSDTVTIYTIRGDLTLENNILHYDLGTVATGGSVTSDLFDRTITVESMTGGGLTSSDGNKATFVIENTINALTETITITNDSLYRQADLYLKNGLTSGTINLESGTNSFGYNVYGSENYVGFDMSGGTINGTAHGDYIEINTLSGGTINLGAGSQNYVDVNNIINTANTLTFINEDTTNQATIRLVGGMSNGTIDLTANGTAGFNVNGGLENSSQIGFDFSGGTVNGSTQADEITIGTMSNSATVHGNDGNDTIIITDYNSGTITGGAGTDDLTIKNVSGSLNISSFTDIENITIEGISGTLTGSIEQDNLTFKAVNNGIIDGQGGGDSYTIEHLSGTNNIFRDAGTVNILFMDPDASYTIEGTTTVLLNGQPLGNTIEHVTLDADITGTANADIFKIGTWASGTITSFGSADDINISSALHNGSFIVENSGGTDRIFLENGISSADLTLNGTDGFLISGANVDTGFNMNGGTLNGGAGNDTFKIDTMDNATLNGNDGNDSITVQNMQGGTINGGEGDNTTWVTNWTGGAITGGSGYNVVNISHVYGSLDLDSDFTNIDDITIHTVHSTGEVTGNRFTIDSLLGGKLSGQDTADNFTIQNMHGGIIDGGDEADTVYVSTLTGSNNTFANVENLTIANIGSGATFSIDDKVTSLTLGNSAVTIHEDSTTMTTSLGNDLGYIREMTTGTLSLNIGNDTLFVEKLSGNSTINAGNSDDIISVVEMGDANAFIFGDSGNDSIYVSKLNSGNIDGGDGDDSVVISSLEGGMVTNTGYSDSDKLIVETMKDGTVSGYDTVNVALFEGGTINSGGTAQVTVESMKGGTLSGEDNNSIIIVNGLEGGSILAGKGKDDLTVHITSTDSQAGDRPNITLGTDGAEDTLKVTIDGSTGQTYHVNVSDYDATDKIKIGDNLTVEIGDLTLNNNTYTYTQDSSTLILYFS